MSNLNLQEIVNKMSSKHWQMLDFVMTAGEMKIKSKSQNGSVTVLFNGFRTYATVISDDAATPHRAPNN